MALEHATIEGADAWSSTGSGKNATVGVVVTHGFTGNPVSTRPLGEALAAQGFAVEVVRLPGHGTNHKDMGATRYADWRAEVQRVLDDLAARVETVVMVGLSMGGTLTLDVATSNQEKVAGLVAINSQVLDRDGVVAKVGSLLAPVLERLAPYIPGKAGGLTHNDIAKGGDEKAYDMVPIASANSLLQELPRVRAKLLDLKVPAVIAWSRQDHSVPNKNSQKVIELLGGAGGDVTELVLERSYHVATLDHDAPLIEQAVLDLIAKVR